MPLADTIDLGLRAQIDAAALDARRCTKCSAYAPSGTWAPGPLIQTETATVRSLGGWLCGKHSRKAWGRVLRAVRHRMAVIEASRRAGWPLSETQYRAWVVREAGVQLELVRVAS